MPKNAVKENVTVRIEPGKRAALDELARATARDRSHVINEAIDAYLFVHRWQIAHIQEGLRQADGGEFAGDDEAAEAYARWR